MYGGAGSGRWSQWVVVKGVGGADVWMEVWAVGDGVSGQWSREWVVRMYGWRCGQLAMESVGSGQGSRLCGCMDGGVGSGRWSQWAVVKEVGGADV